MKPRVAAAPSKVPARDSQTASGSNKLMTASKSRRFVASAACRQRSTRSGVVDSSGIACSVRFLECVLPGEKRLDANESAVSHRAVERELLVQFDVAGAA